MKEALITYKYYHIMDCANKVIKIFLNDNEDAKEVIKDFTNNLINVYQRQDADFQKLEFCFAMVTQTTTITIEEL